jgi:hypothetical protein
MEAAIYDRSGSRAATFHHAKERPVYVNRAPMFCSKNAACRRYTDEEYPAPTEFANAEPGYASLVFSFPNISAPSIILSIYKSTKLAGSSPLLQKDDIGPFRTMELQKDTSKRRAGYVPNTEHDTATSGQNTSTLKSALRR